MARITDIPRIKLNSGYEIPVLGYGTWKSSKEDTIKGVKLAIEEGYRHIDTAYAYLNEVAVGEAIAAKINDGTVKREDLFITTKLWNTFHEPDLVLGHCKQQLKSLQMDYIDLYLMHWPMSYESGRETVPRDTGGKICVSEIPYTDTWKAMEDLVDQGLVRTIGVCNVNHKQLDVILDTCRIKPAMLQVECNPYLSQEPLIAFAKAHEIAVTAYAALGSNDRPWRTADEPVLLENATLTEIAKRNKRTPAQVLLKFGIQRGLVVLAKSVTPERIKSNLQVADFDLNPDEMKALMGLNCNFRACHLNWVKDHKFYPFHELY